MTLDLDAERAAARAFDIRRLPPAFLDDPYPTYRALRRHDPIHLMPDGSYFLSRYEECVAVYRDAALWSSDKTVDFRPVFGDSLLYEHHTSSLVFNDPPYHTRVRRLLAPVFAPRALKALEQRIEALVDRLLDRAASQGVIDLIDDFAAAIPVQLIGDMLGVPQAERRPLRQWSLAILGALEPAPALEQVARGNAAVDAFKAYLLDLVGRRLTEARQDDSEILSTLLAASDFASAGPTERLSAIELIHNCIFLLNAGHETTTNLIGNGVDLLLRHPDALTALRAEPGLIDSAIEEMLRMESSNQLGNRRAMAATALGGVTIAAGAYVHLGIGAANRDPAQFADPERFDIRRAPNRHLAFATGIHACAGMSLARMEARVAIGRLVARCPGLARADAPTRGGRARFRGFLHYPIAVGA